MARCGRSSFNLLLRNFPGGSKWLRGLRLAGNAGSNTARGIGQSLVSVVCVLSGRGLCVGSVTLPECGVSECDIEISMTRRPKPMKAFEPRKKSS